MEQVNMAAIAHLKSDYEAWENLFLSHEDNQEQVNNGNILYGKANDNTAILIMKNVDMYMGPRCNFCDAAKRLLVRNNIPFKEINIALEEGKREEMLTKSNGRKTIPQIFFNDLHIGGYQELRELEKKGELLNLVK